jgi:predicted nucleotidyltransferase
VDLLVDLERGQSLLDLGAFQVDVQDLLAHRVDVVTTAGLRGRVGDHAADDVLPL